ncbi:hypothetical protein WJX82_000991 [Trebouxia sp. C0006]
MAEWHTILDQLEIPDGAVAGLSASDKPVLRGKLLQLPAAERPFFFVGKSEFEEFKREVRAITARPPLLTSIILQELGQNATR